MLYFHNMLTRQFPIPKIKKWPIKYGTSKLYVTYMYLLQQLKYQNRP